MENSLLPDFNLASLSNALPTSRVLFYPCCGKDIYDAISFFHPIVDVFFFCDIRDHYITNDHRKIKKILSDFDLSETFEDYRFAKNNEDRPSRKIVDARGVERIVLSHLYNKKIIKQTQIWKNEKENKEIKIIQLVADGYEAFTNDETLKEIGIFFYRGDSSGEGGSDVGWLETTERKRSGSPKGGHIEEVLQRMTNNGLVVTDGSNSKGRHNFMYKYSNDPKFQSPKIYDITINKNRFKFFGKITPKYGQTLVWQIHK